MFQSNEEIFIAVIASAGFMVFLVMIIIIAVIRYQNRYKLHTVEISALKYDFEQEILKAQLETKDQTLDMVSQEIHDNIGQVLSLAKLNLTRLIATSNISNLEAIESTRDLIGKAISDLRDLAKSMNKEYIRSRQLSVLIQSDLDIIQRTGAYKTTFQLNGAETPIDTDRLLILYRIVQEIFNNIIRHAKGSAIDVSLNYNSEDIEFICTDNGEGFDTSLVPTGTGIRNINSRARVIGATAKIQSKPGSGTMARLKVPINS